MRAEENQVTAKAPIGSAMELYDWSQTPFGAIETWSDDLKTAVQRHFTELAQAKTAPESDPSQNGAASALPQADAFRVRISDALRPLRDATEIQAIAARILGESLGANRVIYIEVVSDGEEVIVHCSYSKGVAPLSGRYRLEDYRRNLSADHQVGGTQIVTDIPNCPDYTDAEKARYSAIDIAAHIDVPLLKNNQFVALLAVHQSTPRQWSATEVKLVEETAEQTWAAVERARTEAALRESEARYRMLFESIEEGFCSVELLYDEKGQPVDHRFLDANPAFETHTGLTQPQGRLASELMPGLEQIWNDLYGRVIATGKSEQVEEYSPAFDRWFNVEVSRIGEQSLHQVAVVFRDITVAKHLEEGRKRAEAALRQREQRLTIATEAAQLGIFEWKVPEDITVWENDRMYELFGLQLTDPSITAEEFFGQYLHPEDAAAFRDELTQAMQTGSLRQATYRIFRRDGTIRWLEVNGQFEFADNGSPLRFIGVNADITDRTRATHNAEFLATVRDDLAEITEVGDIVQIVGDRLHGYLNISSCAFVEINQRADEAVIHHHWHLPQVPSLVGVYALPQFVAPEFLHTAQAGQPIVVRNVATDPRIVDSEKYAALSIGAELNIPLIQDGEWKFSLTVFHPVPYDWSEDEIVLMQELASRIWTKLERTRAEAALVQSEQRFRLMADAVPQIVWITDPQGRVEFFNKQWSNYTGAAYEPTTAAAVAASFVHPEDGDRTMAAFNKARLTGGVFSVEHRIRSAAGTYRWFLVRAEPYRDSQTGEIVRWFGASIDIHDRKQAETALRESEAFNRSIVESSADCIKVLDLNGHLLTLNEPGQCLLEIENCSVLVGTSWVEFWQEPDRTSASQALNTAIAGGTGRFSGYCPTMKGTPKWWDVMVTPILDITGKPKELLVVSRDITDRKQAEVEREQLLQREQKAREAAENANRIKDEFLAVLSHELRSPLNPILGWTRLLQNRKLDPARQAEALNTIERNAKIQTQLIEDLLDISRIMQGKLVLNVAPVSLTFVISAAVETVRLAAEAKHIQITLDLDPAVAPVSGDAARLQQVLWNLLSNAVKFTPNDGQVTVELRHLHQMAQIRVIDTGKGINPQFLPYVFEHFRQEDGATTRKFGGLGLGLAIARQIVELHGGTIAVDSPGEGQGATFTVQIPLTDRSSDLPTSNLPDRSTEDLTGIRVLVADDETDSREFVAFVLEQAGAIVTAVSSGMTALEALPQAAPDVIVSDIGMPEMDGYMLMRQIRARPESQSIPAIALTAYAGEIDQQQAIAAGFQKHFSKPIEPEVVVRVIRALHNVSSMRAIAAVESVGSPKSPMNGGL